MPEPTARTWRSADGLTLHARDYAAADGSARLPVICIHGLTRNARDFEDVAPWIAARGRRVLAVDVRGRGRSERDPDPRNYQPAVYAGDVLALMGQAGISRAVFVGTSMGGLVTLLVAAMKQTAVAGAVLNDIGPELSPVGLGRIMGYVGEARPTASWDEATDYARRYNGLAFPDYTAGDWAVFARRIFRDEGGRPVLDYDPQIAAPFRDTPTTGPAADLWPLFAGLNAGRPVLLVRGAISDLIDADIAARMRAFAPQMAYAEVPSVGHAPMLTEPEAQAALAAFLAEAP